jgi:porin
MNQAGDNATTDDVGDIQGFSNIDADGRTQITELWYEQVFANELVRVKFGKMDANSEFDFVDHGGEFLASSPGFSPTILGFPTYREAATALVVFVYPADWFYSGVGIFDGAAQEGVLTGSSGPKTFFGDPADMFYIGEVGVTWNFGPDALPGRFAGGGWGHTGSFARFDGGTDSGTAGFYFLLDQTLWHENPMAEDDEQGIGLFAQFA